MRNIADIVRRHDARRNVGDRMSRQFGPVAHASNPSHVSSDRGAAHRRIAVGFTTPRPAARTQSHSSARAPLVGREPLLDAARAKR